MRLPYLPCYFYLPLWSSFGSLILPVALVIYLALYWSYHLSDHTCFRNHNHCWSYLQYWSCLLHWSFVLGWFYLLYCNLYTGPTCCTGRRGTNPWRLGSRTGVWLWVVALPPSSVWLDDPAVGHYGYFIVQNPFISLLMPSTFPPKLVMHSYQPG